MKQILQRLRHRLAVAGHKQKQGVAILTVLAIITLMTVLVVSFFNMATTAKTTAKGSVEIQRVTTLKDTIINLVIAQFREASALNPVSTSNPRDIVTWTSQPGAIRTFSGNPSDFSRNRLYKLYSSNVPQIEGIRPYESESLLRDLQRDLAADWAERPDEFTDLNRPVYTAATGDRARATGAVDSTGYSFPIVDPRSYDGQDGDGSLEENTEGFTYTNRAGNVTMQGVDALKEQLALPVRWIYMLQDGTLGFLNDSKEFESLNGARSGSATRENPIVGRLAWWADDESCKVNVNTASIPAFWDTPRTTSKEDQWLAKFQPIAGEFQRYPGHPATVDLSAVFYPNRRWVPPDLQGILTVEQRPAGGKMTPLPFGDALRIWDLAPFIVGASTELRSGSVGTGGGVYQTPIDASVGSSNDDRLFTSMDEVYFKASGTSNKSVNAPRSNLLSENKDSDLHFLKTLERSQFFLTHKSHSPELTNQGYPRVSMYPMDVKAVNNLRSGGSLQQGVSPYDITMALNSTIGSTSSIAGGNAYFFQRSDSNSRHGEFYSTGDGRQRNIKVFKYLKELSRLPIPGYPEAVPMTGVTSSNTEDPSGLSFASKYPSAVAGSGSTVFGSVGGTSALVDSSERSQIVLNMLDFTRSLNLQPPFLTGADRYDDGYGKVAGLCGCANAAGADTNNTHAAALLWTNQTTRTPKGTGKVYGPAEFALVVNVAGKCEGIPSKGGVKTPAFDTVFNRMPQAFRDYANTENPGTRYVIEIGAVFSGFNPKHGWSATFPYVGLATSSTDPGDGTTIHSAAGKPLGITGPNSIQLLTSSLSIGGNQSHQLAKGMGRTTGATPRAGVSPLGGMGGPRATLNPASGGMPILSEYCVIVNGGASDVPLQLVTDPNKPIRLCVADGTNAYDVIQATDIYLPSDFFTGDTLSMSGESLTTLSTKWASTALPFPDPRCLTRSFVVPHGDYRLTCTASRVDGDMFVPVAGYKQSKLAHSFFEMNTLPTGRFFTGSTYNNLIGLIDTQYVPRYILPGGVNTPGLAQNAPNAPIMSSIPLPSADMSYTIGGGSYQTQRGVVRFPVKDSAIKVLQQVSINPDRQLVFGHGRRDGRGLVPNRGSSDPTETGDFDNGTAADPDGPYMNFPDEGDRRRNVNDAYFKNKLFTGIKPTTEGIGGQNISPNFLLRSPVDFGSIPTGVASRVPWQTLRFRPDFGMNNPAKKMRSVVDYPPLGKTFANFCGPKDHFFLDMFWMPVVEPWSISEPFSTKGTINLNQQIIPFTYVERTTALHALLRGERMMAIPNEAADRYKRVNPATGEPDAQQDATYRNFIDAKETMRQITRRYNQGKDFDPDPPGGNVLAFNVFRSASEICELYLVPEDKTATENIYNMESIVGTEAPTGEPRGYWADHLLTGDNVRERPYANIYPRVTVRSNVFKLHMVAQTLQKATSRDPKTFDSVGDLVTAEWRGSCMIERSINPRDPLLANKDYTNLNSLTLDPVATPKLDRYYTYRVTEVKQLTQ